MKRLRFAALVPILAILAACKPVVLAPSGDIAAQQRDLLVVSTVLMLLIIIPVMVLTVYFAWKYRASNKDAEYLPDWAHSTKLELVIWAAPLLIIICLGALTWVGTHKLDPYRPLDRISADKPLPADVKPLEIEVVALDWKWLFIYPEQGIATVNEVAAPVDRPVVFKMTSSTVMNAMYIPALAGMIYAMPGMETKLNAVINEAGDYEGFSANYSGHGFSHMRFRFHGLADADFDAWVNEVKTSTETLDRPKYLELAKPTENAPVEKFGTVDPDLFRRVTNMCVRDGEMCMSEMMALDAQGGSGLAGLYNVAEVPHGVDYGPGNTKTVLGNKPFIVTSFCTPADTARQFGADRQASALVAPGTATGSGDAPRPAISLPGSTGLTFLSPASADAAAR